MWHVLTLRAHHLSPTCDPALGQDTIQVDAKYTHHDSHSFPVPDKVHVGLPALPFNDLGSGARVVHGVGRHQVVPIRWPAEPQHMGCPSTLKETPALGRSSRPTVWPKLCPRE